MLDQILSIAIKHAARRSGPLTVLLAGIVAGGTSWAAPPGLTPRPISAGATATPPEAASQWKKIKLDEPRNGKVEGPKMLRAGEVTDQKLFDAYWTFVVSQLTWPELQSDLPKIRASIKQMLRGGKDPARERLAKELILPFCTKVAKGKEFSPYARVNALLMIGELNQVEPVSLGPPQISLPEARPVLLELLDPKLPVDDLHDALRIEAMVGLMNHIDRGGISDDKQRKQADSLMQGLLKAKEPPTGRNAEVHKWIQRMASEVRAGLNGGEVVRGG